jgi:hypothetical protein
MMDEQPTDLTPLGLDAGRRAALTARILERGAPILARYGSRGPVVVLAGWLRPALAAAALIAAVALGALVAGRPEEAVAGPTTAEALGFPAPLAAWAEVGRTPSLEEVVISLEEAQP